MRFLIFFLFLSFFLRASSRKTKKDREQSPHSIFFCFSVREISVRAMIRTSAFFFLPIFVFFCFRDLEHLLYF